MKLFTTTNEQTMQSVQAYINNMLMVKANFEQDETMPPNAFEYQLNVVGDTYWFNLTALEEAYSGDMLALISMNMTMVQPVPEETSPLFVTLGINIIESDDLVADGWMEGVDLDEEE